MHILKWIVCCCWSDHKAGLKLCLNHLNLSEHLSQFLSQAVPTVHCGSGHPWELPHCPRVGRRRRVGNCPTGQGLPIAQKVTRGVYNVLWILSPVAIAPLPKGWQVPKCRHSPKIWQMPHCPTDAGQAKVWASKDVG